jgi:hypothetical protein
MSKIYPVGLVGESNYQEQISSCSRGERVYICHEADNPYDDLALKVETAGGQTLGYIARSSWLRDAIHEQGRGVTAVIKEIAGPEGRIGVVIDVTLTDDEVYHRQYGANNDQEVTLGRMLRGLFRR